MLLQFRCSNFGPFKDNVIFDMTAIDSDDLDFKVVKLNRKTRVLTTSAIYGANFGGKTKFCDALGYMCDYVLNSPSYHVKYDIDNCGFNLACPYLGDEEYRHKDSEFEVYFTLPSGEEYNYGFCVRDEVGITDEWLNIKAKGGRTYKRIFRREGYIDEYDNDTYKMKLDLSGIPDDSKHFLESMEHREILSVSYGAEVNIEVCKNVMDWFANVKYVHQRYVDNNISSKELPEGFTTDEKVRDDVIKYLEYFGEKDICWLDFDTDPKVKDKTAYDVYAVYNIKNSNDKRGVKINSGQSGLRKLFMLYRPIKEVLENGGVLIVDDLDANLHTLITRNIIQMFFKKEINKKHAQLIFTTHDTWFLYNVMFRVDEVWFVDKKDGASSLYSLADFEKIDKGDQDIVHKDTVERYMVGTYGAIPRFNDDGVETCLFSD